MKQNPYAGLKKVILASMIIVPLIPFVSVLGIGYYYFTKSLENNTIASIQRIVHDHRQMIESFLMEAAYTMITQNKRRLTIIDSGKVIGIIREQDLFFEIDRILREV